LHLIHNFEGGISLEYLNKTNWEELFEIFKVSRTVIKEINDKIERESKQK